MEVNIMQKIYQVLSERSPQKLSSKDIGKILKVDDRHTGIAGMLTTLYRHGLIDREKSSVNKKAFVNWLKGPTAPLETIGRLKPIRLKKSRHRRRSNGGVAGGTMAATGSSLLHEQNEHEPNGGFPEWRVGKIVRLKVVESALFELAMHHAALVQDPSCPFLRRALEVLTQGENMKGLQVLNDAMNMDRRARESYDD